jgi:heptaprenyl diphosphate synthase
MSRKEVYDNTFGAKALFAAGLAIMPSILFNPSTEYRIIQFLFLCVLVLFSGKKLNPFFTIIVIAFIVAFNLIIPYGRVLFSIGAFKITSGALKAGIHRAVTLEALVMLSKLSISHELKIPGAFGELLGESLRIFSVLMNKKLRVTGKNFIVEIDNLMLELSKEEIHQPIVSEIRTKPIGYVVLVIVSILLWLPWVINFL